MKEPFGGLTFGFSFAETLVTAVCLKTVLIKDITSIFSGNSLSKRLMNSDISVAFALLLGFK